MTSRSGAQGRIDKICINMTHPVLGSGQPKSAGLGAADQGQSTLPIMGGQIESPSVGLVQPESMSCGPPGTAWLNPA